MSRRSQPVETNLQEFVCRLRSAAVCVHRARGLLVRHAHPQASQSYWLPPGGGVRPGETLQGAALRELWEETGYEGDVVGMFGCREVFKPAGTVFEVFFRVTVLRENTETPSAVGGQASQPVHTSLCPHVPPKLSRLDATDPRRKPKRPRERVLKEARWFAAEELQDVVVYPEQVADWLRNPRGHCTALDRLCMAPVVVRRK